MGDLTPKQEAFALKYVECGNASEAYRHAYDVGENTKPETVWENASKTLADTKVSTRVMELQEQARERHAVTVDSLTQELNEAREQAKEDPKGASAHVAAIMGKAKLHGLLVERQELTGKDGGPIEFDQSPSERIASRITSLTARGSTPSDTE